MIRQRSHPKWWLLIMVLLVGWLGLTTVASADNADVKDMANILDIDTEAYVAQANDEDMQRVKGHPQIAVVTDTNKKEAIEDRAQTLFDRYQIGRKGWDNGVMILINPKTHQVRMQTGYGLEEVLPDAYTTELLDANTRTKLHDGQYNDATRQMVQKLADRIRRHQDEIQKPVPTPKKGFFAKTRQMFGLLPMIIVGMVLLLSGGLGVWVAIKYQEKKEARQGELDKWETDFNEQAGEVTHILQSQGLVLIQPLELRATDRKYLSNPFHLLHPEQIMPVLNVMVIDQVLNQHGQPRLLDDEKSVFNTPAVTALWAVKNLDWHAGLDYPTVAQQVGQAQQNRQQLAELVEQADAKSELEHRWQQTAIEHRKVWSHIRGRDLKVTFEKRCLRVHGATGYLKKVLENPDWLTGLYQSWLSGEHPDPQTQLQTIYQQGLAPVLQEMQTEMDDLQVDRELEAQLGRWEPQHKVPVELEGRLHVLSTQEKRELLAAAAAAGWTTDRLIRKTLDKVELEERRQGLANDDEHRDDHNTFGGHGGASGGGGGTMSF